MTNSPTEALTPSGLPSIENAPPTFVDRRSSGEKSGAFERRQFGNSHSTLSPDARELAEAIDSYKVQHRRRFITFEEMLKVIHQLGYQKR
jgi:hypothetical protein